MGLSDTQTWMMLAAIVVLAALAVGAWFYRRQQSHKLQDHYGTEYTRTMTELGSRTKAESELRAREKRVERLELIPLAAPEAGTSSLRLGLSSDPYSRVKSTCLRSATE